MLVLTRKSGETILVGENITITVIRTGHSVKIGVEAPVEVKILRGELTSKEGNEDAV